MKYYYYTSSPSKQDLSMMDVIWKIKIVASLVLVGVLLLMLLLAN